ncbi:hypothetical protein DRQ33_01245 [bacterium]|nr:MAG: hypothetical protein DRQ33_01245 [bacterium]
MNYVPKNIFIKIIWILSISTGIAYGWSFGDVVINELMWMGSSRSPYDEYLELRNMTSVSINFSSTRWSIYRNNELLVIIDTGVLPGDGYFLISRLDTTESVLAVLPDMISPALILNNSDVQYKLYAGPDSTHTLIDIADDSWGTPLAGNYWGIGGGIHWSMERNEPPGDGTLAASWHDACLSVNFDPGSSERGTPKLPNRKNTPPQWSGVIPPTLATDSDDLIFTAVACQDTDNIPDSMQVKGIWWKLGESPPIYSAVHYGIASGTDVDVVLPNSFTQPGQYYEWKLSLDDGQDTLYRSGTLFVHFDTRDILIDEICWGGSSQSISDEWIELLNTRSDTIYLEQTPIFIWRNMLSGELQLDITLDSGIIPPDGRFLIKRLSADDYRTAVSISPQWVKSDFTLYDGIVRVAITDRPDTNYFIDIAGNGSYPASGENNCADSLWASMYRVSPASDGSSPSSWKTSTVTINFKPGMLDRGTPGAETIQNHPPILATPDTFDLFYPDTGTRDTVFIFNVIYSDSDSSAPDSVVLLLDMDYDGIWSPSEIFPLSIDSSGIDYFSGTPLYTEISGLTPSRTGGKFTYRVSDGQTITPFPVPAKSGPVVYPTAGMQLSHDVWITDTLHWFQDKYTISSPIQIRNVSDLPAIFKLRIFEEDTFEYDCCYPYCEGGWISTCDSSELDCNKYMLSAIFLPEGTIPVPALFNEYGNEDCLTPINFRTARADTFGVSGNCIAENLGQGHLANLWFIIYLPRISYGVNMNRAHKITVQIKCVVILP